MRRFTWLCSLLFVVHLSHATQHWDDYETEDDHVQTSDYDDIYDDDDTAWLTRRRARRQQRLPTVVDDVSVSGTVERATLTSRRERIQARRRKKFENASRRGRGGGSRAWRRRSFAHSSPSVFTTTMSSTTDQQSSMTSTSTQPATSFDLMTRYSEVRGVDEVTEDNGRSSDVLMETFSDNGDDMMILVPSNGTTIKLEDLSQRGM